MTVPKNLVKTHVTCCVPQCTTRGCEGIPLHHFPKCDLEKMKWKLALSIEKPVTNSMRVCGLHFDRDCYINRRIDVDFTAKGRKLKRNICPSKNLPDVSLKAVKKKKRDEKKCCYVPGCRKDEEDGVSLHLFPRATEFISVKDGSKKPDKVNRKTLWQGILKIKNQIPEWAVVCSNHFQSQDFLPLTTTLDGKKVYRLKKIAVPNRNLPTSASRCHRKIPLSPEPSGLNHSTHILNESRIESEKNTNDESPLLLLLRAADEVSKDNATLQSSPKKKILQTSPQRLPRNENADVGASQARSEPIVTRKPQSTIRHLRAPPIFFEGRRCIKL